jgi:hypothetical protein
MELLKPLNMTMSLAERPRFTSYRPLPLTHTWKKRLGCTSTMPVVIAGHPLVVRGYWVHYHNLYHLEIANLDRILMGKDLVSGLGGFYSPMYHDDEVPAEYDGILDEARVAVHEAMTRPSLYSTIKLFRWSLWFLRQWMNPIAIIYRHWVSLQKFDTESVLKQNPNIKVFAFGEIPEGFIPPEGYEKSIA